MDRLTKRYAGALAFLLLLSCSDDSEKPTAPAANQPPRINGVTVDPAVLEVGQQARIRVDATDPDQDQLTASYVSQLGVVTPDANSLTAAYRPSRAGRDLLSVRVADARGAETRFDVYVTVNEGTTPGTGEGPPPSISFSPGPSSNGTIVVGQGDNLRVNLCGESAASYRVSWGDGTADATTCSSSHAYAASGTYRLVAQGSGGALAEARAKANFRVELFVSVIQPGGPAATTSTTTTTTTTTKPPTTTTTTTTSFLLSLLSP